MTQPAVSPLPPVAEFARQARITVPEVARDVTDQVAELVAVYAGTDGHRHPLVEDAIAAALNEYLDLFDGMPHRDRGAGLLLRKIGQKHATEYADLTALYAALHVAGTRVWSSLTAAGGPNLEDNDTLGRLAHVAHRYLAHLTQEASEGFRVVRRRLEVDVKVTHRRLAEALLSGRLTDSNLNAETVRMAESLPNEIVVVVGESTDGSRLTPTTIEPHCLLARHGPYLVLIGDADDSIALVSALSSLPAARVAFSWAVVPDDAHAAHRWALRALSLVQRGVIPEQTVIDCATHRTQIWLHSEPELRQRLCQELLAPLLAETPNSREILSETLLAWLESRDSAPAIAARLGVHPQTVRYRWKRINELFGEDLHEPEFVVQVTMLLKASVPLWKAGDQSDFERFQSEVGS